MFHRKKSEPVIYQDMMAQPNESPIVDIPEETELERKMEAVLNDPVNHPSHYTSGAIEVIDFIEDQRFPYHLGNAVK